MFIIPNTIQFEFMYENWLQYYDNSSSVCLFLDN